MIMLAGLKTGFVGPSMNKTKTSRGADHISCRWGSLENHRLKSANWEKAMLVLWRVVFLKSIPDAHLYGICTYIYPNTTQFCR